MLLKSALFLGRDNLGTIVDPQGIAVEVGTHRGDFAHAFLAKWNGGQKFHCVDPYQSNYDPEDSAGHGDRVADFACAQQALAKYGTIVEFIKLQSLFAAELFANNSLSFVYIDACHQYAAVKEDLEAWWPKIKKGGILAGHDFLNFDHVWGRHVQPAVFEFAEHYAIPDLYLVPEPPRWPWSYYMKKI